MTVLFIPLDLPQPTAIAVPPQGVVTAATAIDLPFRIDSTGRVATTTDLGRQALNRIMGIIGAAYGERVMRPTYGTPIKQALFGVSDPVQQAAIAGRIKDAVTFFEPGVVLETVSLDTPDPADGTLVLTINYRLLQTGEVRTASVSLGGTVQETVTRAR